MTSYVLACLVCAAAMPAGADAVQRYVRVLRAESPLSSGQWVVVRHQFGNIVFDMGSAGRVALTAEIRVQAAEMEAARHFATAIRVALDRKGDSVVIRTVYPKRGTGSVQGYGADLEIAIPDQGRLKVENSFGDVRLGAFRGTCVLSNRFGDIELEETGGCDVTNRYGNVRLSRSLGPVRIANEFGNVLFRAAEDDVDVRNRYGNVEADGTRGNVAIANEFGTVSARRGRGRMQISNQYGDIAACVEQPGLAELELVSRLGRVDVGLLQGVGVRVHGGTSHGSITTALPFSVVEDGDREAVNGRQGNGRTRIVIDGVWSDVFIRSDTPPGAQSKGPDRR